MTGLTRHAHFYLVLSITLKLENKKPFRQFPLAYGRAHTTSDYLESRKQFVSLAGYRCGELITVDRLQIMEGSGCSTWSRVLIERCNSSEMVLLLFLLDVCLYHVIDHVETVARGNPHILSRLGMRSG